MLSNSRNPKVWATICQGFQRRSVLAGVATCGTWLQSSEAITPGLAVAGVQAAHASEHATWAQLDTSKSYFASPSWSDGGAIARDVRWICRRDNPTGSRSLHLSALMQFSERDSENGVDRFKTRVINPHETPAAEVLIELLGEEDGLAALCQARYEHLLRASMNAITKTQDTMIATFGEAVTREIVSKVPQLLAVTHANIEAVVKVLEDVFEHPQHIDFIRQAPSILRGQGSAVRATWETLREVMGHEAAVEIVHQCPTLLSINGATLKGQAEVLIEQFGEDGFKELIGKSASVLITPSTTTKGALTALTEILGEQDALKYIKKTPGILRAPEATIRGSSEALISTLGPGAAKDAIIAYPEIVRTPKATIIGCFNVLKKVFGDEASKYLRPNLLRRSPTSMEDTFNFLEKVLGSGKLGAQGVVSGCPSVLAKSVRSIQHKYQRISKVTHHPDRVVRSKPSCLTLTPTKFDEFLGRQAEQERIRLKVSGEFDAEKWSHLAEDFPGNTIRIAQRDDTDVAFDDMQDAEHALIRLVGINKTKKILGKIMPSSSMKGVVRELQGLLGKELAATVVVRYPEILECSEQEVTRMVARLTDMVGDEEAKLAIKSSPKILKVQEETWKKYFPQLKEIFGAAKAPHKYLRYVSWFTSGGNVSKSFQALVSILGSEEAARDLLEKNPLVLRTGSQTLMGRYARISEVAKDPEQVILRKPGILASNELPDRDFKALLESEEMQQLSTHPSIELEQQSDAGVH